MERRARAPGGTKTTGVRWRGEVNDGGERAEGRREAWKAGRDQGGRRVEEGSEQCQEQDLRGWEVDRWREDGKSL